MRIGVTGSTGLIGSALVAHLRSRGHDVQRFVRRASQAADEISWDPEREVIDVSALGRMDGVIHLAGVSIAAQRWSPSFKEAIRRTRIDSTRLLVDSFGKIASPPRFFLCASAIGYYGDRGEEILTEVSSRGAGFLSSVTEEWETTARLAEKHGVRVVNLRFGQVLARRGGAIPSLLPVFRLGLGGPIGSGHSWWSWILLHDVCRVIEFVIDREDVVGPLNVTSPHPVRNRDFTKALARAIHRPALIPIPPLLLKILFGEFAKEVLLASTHVIPRRLNECGFTFAFPQIEMAMKEVISNISK
ncbi:MAG: TIGR01777 family oxidoreductase [Thermogutta sp.]